MQSTTINMETYNPPSTLLSTSLKLAALSWARFRAGGTSSSRSS